MSGWSVQRAGSALRLIKLRPAAGEARRGIEQSPAERFDREPARADRQTAS